MERVCVKNWFQIRSKSNEFRTWFTSKKGVTSLFQVFDTIVITTTILGFHISESSRKSVCLRVTFSLCVLSLLFKLKEKTQLKHREGRRERERWEWLAGKREKTALAQKQSLLRTKSSKEATRTSRPSCFGKMTPLLFNVCNALWKWELKS